MQYSKQSMIACLFLVACSGVSSAEEPAKPVVPKDAMKAALSNELLILNLRVSQRAPSVEAFSKRGDIHLFLGKFPKAVVDYQEMLKVDPDLEQTHWRLGIALYFDGQYQAAADQFEKYYALDKVDRENGIWHYFSNVKALGVDQARAKLLVYEKTDRAPFDDIYEMIAGKLTGEELLARIAAKHLGPVDSPNQLFYAELYTGLNDAVLGKTASARLHLEKASASPWPERAGFGPNYMWHVGRLQLELLQKTP